MTPRAPERSKTPIPLRVLPPRVRQPGGDPVPCLECGRCCTYLAVGINAPRTPRYVTDVLWYLYHERVSVHRDADGEWSVVFETRCRNLQDDLKCSVYAQRPHICRAFDNDGCEVNAPDNRDHVFHTAAQFLEFLRAWRPRVYLAVRKRYVPEGHLPPGDDPAVRPLRRRKAVPAKSPRRAGARSR
jgi:Fe-S-cluster containining protein